VLRAVSTVLLLCAVSSCESTTDGANVTLVHPIDPNGNGLISAERSYAVPSSVNRIVEDGTGGYYFCGAGGTIGRFDAASDVAWSDGTLNVVNDLVRLPSADLLVAVGDIDLDGDGKKDAGAVGVYAASGNLLDTLRVYSDTLAVTLGGVAVTGDGDPAELVVVGELAVGTRRPYAARIAVGAADGAAAVLDDTTYTDMFGMGFVSVATGPASAGTVYAVRASPSNAPTATVVELDDSLHVGWISEIAATHVDSTSQLALLRQIVYDGGVLYVAGEVQVDKGGYFARAGLVAAMSTAGDTSWVAVDNISPWQESYDGLTVVGGFVYPVGRGVQTYLPDYGDHLGYGLFSKRAAAAGTLSFTRTFGDNRQWNGFRGIAVTGATAHCVGFQRDPAAAVSRGWRVEIDVPN